MRSLNTKQIEQVKEALKKKNAYAVSKELGINIRIVTEIRDGIYVNTVEPKNKGGPRNHDPAKKQNRKFNAKQIKEIRELLLSKNTVKSIAKKYNVNDQTIRDIRDGYTYRDVR